MKKEMKLLCGILAVVGLVCGSVAITYVMGNIETANVAVVNTDRAILCTIIALGIGGVTLLRRHMWKNKR